MRNFQGIVFIWTRTNSEIFKSALEYLKSDAKIRNQYTRGHISVWLVHNTLLRFWHHAHIMDCFNDSENKIIHWISPTNKETLDFDVRKLKQKKWVKKNITVIRIIFSVSFHTKSTLPQIFSKQFRNLTNF